MLGPLQDNGGPTFTHALLSGSPAIDQGKNLSGAASDQRGFSRLVDFPAIANATGGDGSDIGAFEFQNRPPTALCRDVTTNADTDCEANVGIADVDNGSFDPDSDPFVLSVTPPGPYPLGDTSVTLTVIDSHCASSSCTATVTVVDNTPPTIGGVSVTPDDLRVPNHKLVLVTVNYTVADNCGVADYGLSASSNEPDNGLGDGNSESDIQLIPGDPHHLYLRAERSGTGTGRVYTITITCTDTSGNTATVTAQVTVAHNKRSNGRGNRIDTAAPGGPSQNVGPGTGPGNPGIKPLHP